MSVYLSGSEHMGVVKFFQFWCVFEIFQNKILEKRNSMHYDVVVRYTHLKYTEKQIEIIALKRASVQFSSVQSLSRVQFFVTPWTVKHPRPPCPSPLLKLTQTHVHWVGDAIQPSHPLLSPSPALNPSQHQGLFKWVSSSHQVTKVLEF